MADRIEKLDDSELTSIVSSYINQSTAFQETELSNQIADSLKYYYGQPLGNEVEGNSTVVSRDVADAVDWIMPSLMNIFGNGEKTVEFEPQGANDAEEAKQATEYINYLFNSRCNGFSITYQWFKDALLCKNGILKHYWEERDEPEFDYYTGLDQEALELLLADEGVDILEKSVEIDGTFSVKISKIKKKGSIKIENVPPEEFLINTEAKSIEDADFVAHARNVTLSDLVGLGFTDDDLEGVSFNDSNFGNQDVIYQARHSIDSTDQLINSSQLNEAVRKVKLYECYVKVDVDGDGLAELRRILYVDNKILSNEEWDLVPFSAITPNIISHKFYGLSLYDQLKEIQDIKTTLLRNLLDNMYRINNGRFAVLDGQVNLRDLLRSRSGGVVREKVSGAVRALDTPKLPTESFQMLSYLDTLAENRSGASSRTNGLDDNVLHSNQASSAVNQIMTAAQQKQKLIARVFAETGMKSLFSNLYALVTKHQDREDVYRLRDKFVTVNPASWRTKYNVIVIADVGNDNKDQKLLHLQRMWEMTQTVLNSGGMNILTNYDKIYNLLTEATKNAGFRNYNDFWSDPATPEGKQAIEALKQAQSKPSPDEIKANAEAQSKQAKAQIDGQELQMKGNTSMRELELREREVAVKERELSLKEEEISLARSRLELDTYGKVADATLEKELNRPVAIGSGGGSSNV